MNDPAQQAPPPAEPQTRRLWILGATAGIVVLGLVAIGVLFAVRGGDDKQGKYSGTATSNACDLVDVSVLAQWAGGPAEERRHTEDKTTFGGPVFNCTARDFAANSGHATLTVNASIGKDVEMFFDMAQQTALGTTGTGRRSGSLSGLGAKAYFTSHADPSDSYATFEYSVGVLDDNLSVRVSLDVRGGNGFSADMDRLATVCREQAKLVLERLK